MSTLTSFSTSSLTSSSFSMEEKLAMWRKVKSGSENEEPNKADKVKTPKKAAVTKPRPKTPIPQGGMTGSLVNASFGLPSKTAFAYARATSRIQAKTASRSKTPTSTAQKPVAPVKGLSSLRELNALAARQTNSKKEVLKTPTQGSSKSLSRPSSAPVARSLSSSKPHSHSRHHSAPASSTPVSHPVSNSLSALRALSKNIPKKRDTEKKEENVKVEEAGGKIDNDNEVGEDVFDIITALNTSIDEVEDVVEEVVEVEEVELSLEVVKKEEVQVEVEELVKEELVKEELVKEELVKEELVKEEEVNEQELEEIDFSQTPETPQAPQTPQTPTSELSESLDPTLPQTPLPTPAPLAPVDTPMPTANMNPNNNNDLPQITSPPKSFIDPADVDSPSALADDEGEGRLERRVSKKKQALDAVTLNEIDNQPELFTRLRKDAEKYQEEHKAVSFYNEILKQQVNEKELEIENLESKLNSDIALVKHHYEDQIDIMKQEQAETEQMVQTLMTQLKTGMIQAIAQTKAEQEKNAELEARIKELEEAKA
ncbi:hypothetical protein TL16_g00427 [Triparma laevis f. inornata]|uniref:Uncharacterized protein n=1 Tax=Triparma laevis f. inornata TaxID=1714386 RepID=A0A9W6Z6I8_9STRA|nr:hypothetical protein TL16_g00427 [Triparma laevis f. inornata]